MIIREAISRGSACDKRDTVVKDGLIWELYRDKIYFPRQVTDEEKISSL